MGFNIGRARKVSEREDQGADVQVKDELGEKQYYDVGEKKEPVVIVMAGANSSRYRRKKEEQERRRLNNKSLTEGKFTSDAKELAVACTIGWRGIEDDDGRPVECNEYNVNELFTAAPWVYNDCVEAMNDAARFSPSSSPQQ